MSTRRDFLVQSAAGVAAAASVHLAETAAACGFANPANTPDKRGVFHALDLPRVSLAGEFGRRVECIVEANILKIDIDAIFLPTFRNRAKGQYVGFGKFIDSVVRLASASGDERLIALKNKAIAALLATQEPDGYIGTVADPQARMKVIWDLHESAYVIWALVSDHRYFGTRKSLQAAQRLADFVLPKITVKSPQLTDRLADGVAPMSMASLGFDHALLALSRASGQRRYRDFVVNVLMLNDYHPPLRAGIGVLDNHAYAYMGHCLAQLDLYGETGDPRLLRATRQALGFMSKGDGLLVTGSCSDGECWHDTQTGLLNTSETCASAYVARLMDALLKLEGNSFYGDVMERDIYNALFAATAPDGSRSRYFTPFDGQRQYDAHDPIYCCANNNKRFLADLRSWMYYGTAAGGVAVNLYNASSATLTVAGDVTLRMEQLTDYPTSGDVLLKIDPSKAARFEVKLRIPRWCKSASVAVNGAAAESVAGGQFHVVEREWKRGDTLELKMPMEWRFVRGRRSQVGRAAVLRGPVIFTLNPERNPKLLADQVFEPRLLTINPLEIQPPAPDESMRPGGVSCTINGWTSSTVWFSLVERLPVVLSEYPDPNGQGIYFRVPGEALSVLTDDELI